LKKNEKVAKFHETHKKFKEEKEKKELRKVVKIHTDDEFTKKMEEEKGTGKLVVIDFFATWCGPCVFISPYFAELSEQFTDVCFLKIDVDVCSSTSASCGVRAMPTFQFYKNGAKVDEMVGASKEKLKQLLEQHK